MYNLNLLNSGKRSSLRQEAANRIVIQALTSAAALLAVTLGALLIIDQMLSQKLNRYQDQLTTTKVVTAGGQTLPITEITRQLNAELKVLKPIATETKLAALLIRLAEIWPPRVQLSSLAVSDEDKQLTMKGVAASRNDLPALQQELENLPWLTNFNITRDLSQRTNIDFDLKAAVDFSKLKNP